MCGIAGVATFGSLGPPSERQLRAMCDTIVHRGPDGEGIDICENVGLGMRRLAVIDVAGGNQPVFNEDRTVRVVFNGEIYNFRELRGQLEKSGHRFRSRSDTEVLVHGYEEWGADLPKYLNGMFAFSLHDSAHRRLLLARDHLGIKPLFYSFDRNRLIWGSEIKVLLASGLLERALDLDALGEFLAWEYVPGASTLFAAVKKLEPGFLIEMDLTAPDCEPRRYWDIPAGEESSPRSPGEWQELVAETLDRCVRRQLISDVPLGAFLSGGVDSSLVVSAMGEAETFSIGFDDPSYNELDYARAVAESLGVKHTVEVIKPHVADLFDHLMTYMDDPIGDFSIFPTYLVSRLARRHVTVALSGDGGDELFGGYETYLADRLQRIYALLPSALRKRVLAPFVHAIPPRPEKKGPLNKLKRFVEGAELPDELGHARWRIFASDALCNELFAPDAAAALTRPRGEHITELFREAGPRSPLARSLYVDVKSYLSDNCLVKVDRMSMANSLESRVPLLDRELVELAFQVPDELKIRNGKTKVLLKRIAAQRIPERCVYRPKEGFSIPMKHWLSRQFRPLLEDLLAPNRIKSGGLFDPETVTRLRREHFSGAANHSHVLWSLLMFEAWRSRWLEAA